MSTSHMAILRLEKKATRASGTTGSHLGMSFTLQSKCNALLQKTKLFSLQVSHLETVFSSTVTVSLSTVFVWGSLAINGCGNYIGFAPPIIAIASLPWEQVYRRGVTQSSTRDDACLATRGSTVMSGKGHPSTTGALAPLRRRHVRLDKCWMTPSSMVATSFAALY